MFHKFIALVFITAFSALSFCQEHEHGSAKENLGKVRFPVSCKPETQAQFDRALAMLHSFWYQQGLAAFTEITKADPDCAMAYWGLALLARGNPLAAAPDAAALKTGADAAHKAKELGGKTSREEDYIAAINTYYADHEKVDHRTRVHRYESKMEQLYKKYPADQEAAVFYALALNEAITVLPPDKTYARPLKAAQILEQILSVQPDHPGALHYLIHSYDFPALASRGLAAAKRYSGVAPFAPHALHMPSHIFSMLGMWQESITANQAALRVSNTYVHAMDFMAYAYLQGAQDQEAKKLVDQSAVLQKEQKPAIDRTPTGGVLAVFTAYAAIPARYAIERGNWSEACAVQMRPLVPVADAILYFTRAVGCARSGNNVQSKRDLEQLQMLRSGLDPYWSEQIDIQRLAAQGWINQAERKHVSALQKLRAAADHEDASEKHVAMENRLWPMREQLAEMLLLQNKPSIALLEFERSLKNAPNRFRSFYGAAKSAQQSKDKIKARTYYEKLIELCGHTDSNRPELTEAKAYLAAK